MRYYPSIKTKMGHLEAVSSELTSGVCPIIDLSKVGNDRIASKFGDVIASASAVVSKLGNKEYFIDLDSQHESRVLSYDYLLRSKNGYENWRAFLKDNFGKNCTPVMQFSPSDDTSDLSKQILKVIEHFGNIGIRVPFWIKEEHLKNLKMVINKEGVAGKVTFFVDIGQFNSDMYRFCLKTKDWSVLNDFKAVEHIRNICGEDVLPRVVFLSNSFPSSIVVDVDEETESAGLVQGSRALTDWPLWEYVRQRFGNMAEIEYGDYATINQESGRGRGWIPRVDVPYTRYFTFTRQRTQSNMNKSLVARDLKPSFMPSNNAEALKIICKKILQNEDIEFASKRVKDIITETSKGKPPRADPGYWTAVRMSEHIANIGSMVEVDGA